MRRATTYSELRSCRHCSEILEVNASRLSKIMVLLILEDAIKRVHCTGTLRVGL
jgi:hypothetical protein